MSLFRKQRHQRTDDDKDAKNNRDNVSNVAHFLPPSHLLHTIHLLFVIFAIICEAFSVRDFEFLLNKPPARQLVQTMVNQPADDRNSCAQAGDRAVFDDHVEQQNECNRPDPELRLILHLFSLPSYQRSCYYDHARTGRHP